MAESKSHDMINNPPHYNQNKYEVIDIIEDAGLGYHLSAALKYILRCKYKDKEIEDLQKAVWYINRYIDTQTNVGKDLGYNAWTCRACNKGTNLVDSNQTCEDCRNKQDDMDNWYPTCGNCQNPGCVECGGVLRCPTCNGEFENVEDVCSFCGTDKPEEPVSPSKPLYPMPAIFEPKETNES